MDSEIQQFNIIDLKPYTNYTVHVQPVVQPFIRVGREIPGEESAVVRNRTLSAPDDDIPTAPPMPTSAPTSSEIVILIGDPNQIDTGKVM